MAIGIPVRSYAEDTGTITGKKLRQVSPEEVTKFNDDLVNIAALYGQESIRLALDEYQSSVFSVVRQVMQEANAPYGGAGALGDEVSMRAIRPVDVNYTGGNDTWVRDNTAIDVTVAADRQITYFTRTTGETEGLLIIGALIEEGSRRVINAYLWNKNQKAYPALTLPFSYTNPNAAAFVKFQSPIAQFTEEALVFNVNVVEAVFSYMAIVGVYTTRASQITDTYSTGN